MGTEALWIPLALSAVSGGVSYANSRSTAKKQDNEAAANIRQQAARQQQADGEVRQLIAKTGESNPEGDKRQAFQQYMQALDQARPGTNAGLAPVNGASAAYQKDSQDAALGVQDWGTKIAGLMSRIDAPQTQRTREGNLASDYGSNIDRIKRFSAGDDAMSRMRMDGIRRNPMLDLFSSLLDGAAAGYKGKPGKVGSVTPKYSGSNIYGPQ